MPADVHFIFLLMTFSVHSGPSSTTSLLLEDLFAHSVSQLHLSAATCRHHSWAHDLHGLYPCRRSYKPPFTLDKPLALNKHIFVTVTAQSPP